MFASVRVLSLPTCSPLFARCRRLHVRFCSHAIVAYMFASVRMLSLPTCSSLFACCCCLHVRLCSHSRVKNLTFMTAFWLRCFDCYFNLFEPFKQNLIKATHMNKYTFLDHSITRNPFLTSVWYKNTFLTAKSEIADKFESNAIFWVWSPCVG